MAFPLEAVGEAAATELTGKTLLCPARRRTAAAAAGGRSKDSWETDQMIGQFQNSDLTQVLISNLLYYFKTMEIFSDLVFYYQAISITYKAMYYKLMYSLESRRDQN